MDLERFRSEVFDARQDPTSAAPDACRGCANLMPMKVKAGNVALTCLLERAYAQNTARKSEPTAEFLERSLIGPEDELIEGVDDNFAAKQFRDHAQAANDECPILARLQVWLPTAAEFSTVDISPPFPFVAYNDLRAALGLRVY